jgi:hypothetical protein
MRTACKLLSSDGTGFGLLRALAGLPVAAFLCLSVENGWFWLPAINGGNECFGLPALRPSEFANALEEMARSLGTAPRVNQTISKAEVA